MSELVLVRHGQASFGAESYDRLSAIGMKQVAILAQYWQSVGEQFDICYAGTLLRQQQTAEALQPVVNQAGAQIHPGFNEYNGNPLLRIYLRDHAASEGFAIDMQALLQDRRSFQLVLEAATRHWLQDTLRPAADDGDFEAWAHFQARVHGALDELMQQHGSGARVLIATSGGVIALALQRALGIPDNRTIETNWMVHNSSVTRLVYSRGKVSLGSFNALPHLAAPGMAELVTFR